MRGSAIFKSINKKSKARHTLMMATTTRFNIDILPANTFNLVINLKDINDLRYINKFFESVNQKVPAGSIFISSVITNTLHICRSFIAVSNLTCGSNRIRRRSAPPPCGG